MRRRMAVIAALLLLASACGGSNDPPRRTAVLLQPGTDPKGLDQRNEARVRIGSVDEEWIAEEQDIMERELEAGTSQLDSYSIDGNRATGTAHLP